MTAMQPESFIGEQTIGGKCIFFVYRELFHIQYFCIYYDIYIFKMCKYVK